MNSTINRNIRTGQGGFTLIELVIVIVLLGILAAVAIPRFIDLSADAEQAAVAGVAGSLSSAFAINFAGCAASGFDADDANCVAVANCTDGANLLIGDLDTKYEITGGELTFQDGTDCTVQVEGDTEFSATFQGIGTTP